MVGLVHDLSISSDTYHRSETLEAQTRNAREAARQLGIPLGVITIGEPVARQSFGAVPEGESAIMFRGRAVDTLAAGAARRPCTDLVTCPPEDLREPGRVHIDPMGHVHVCQGISIGNVLETPLDEICAGYDADRHPIAGPLLAGGPASRTETAEQPSDTRVAWSGTARRPRRYRLPHATIGLPASARHVHTRPRADNPRRTRR